MTKPGDCDCFLVLTMPGQPLKLLLSRPGGDLTIGFEGCTWHTHGDLLRGEYGTETVEEAAGFFLQDLLAGEREIVIHRKAGGLIDAWVSYRRDSPFFQDPNSACSEADESIEVTRWFGCGR